MAATETEETALAILPSLDAALDPEVVTIVQDERTGHEELGGIYGSSHSLRAPPRSFPDGI